MHTYCIDTSALIDGWHDYPIENFNVWDKIKGLIRNNQLVSPYHVLDELGVGGDDLYEWCKENYFFVSPTENTGPIVTEIKKNFPEFIPKRTSRVDWADPYVIAIAMEKDQVVVSHETRKQKDEKIFYIPDICDEYTIEHISFLELIQKEKWKFVSK